jgi:hypothetical protein
VYGFSPNVCPTVVIGLRKKNPQKTGPWKISDDFLIFLERTKMMGQPTLGWFDFTLLRCIMYHHISFLMLFGKSCFFAEHIGFPKESVQTQELVLNFVIKHG